MDTVNDAAEDELEADEDLMDEEEWGLAPKQRWKRLYHKHVWALDEKEVLEEQLRAAEKELHLERIGKEAALEQVIVKQVGYERARDMLR